MKYFLALLLATTVLHAQDLSPADTTALLASFAEQRKGAAMQVDFREEKHLALMQKPVIETGTLAFLPPDKFRREVKGKSLTVCDGTTLWLYYPEFNEAEKYLLASNRALRESLSAMTSGIGLQDIAKNYAVQAQKRADGYQITLTPKNSSLRKSVSQIRLTISEALVAKRMEILGAQGDNIITTFSNEQKANLTPGDFKFQPPKDVTISEPLK